jgi:hypothetical protein|nr:MAG TPA: hypothetical protein [Bacteriophage sp.]
MNFSRFKNLSPVFKTLMENAKSGIPKKLQILIGILAFIWLFPIVLDITFIILSVFWDYKSDFILKILPRLEQLITILTSVSAVACLMAILGLFTDTDGDGIPNSLDKDNSLPVTNNTIQVNVANPAKKLPLHIDK